MNQTTAQLQTQVVSQALNQMEDVMNQTIKEKCVTLINLFKSKCYEASQMEHECRRMWLLFLLSQLKWLNQVCDTMSVTTPSTCFAIHKDESYDRQISSVSNGIFVRMDWICRKTTVGNGRMKKLWIDCMDTMTKNVQNFSYDDSDSESEYESED